MTPIQYMGTAVNVKYHILEYPYFCRYVFFEMVSKMFDFLDTMLRNLVLK